MRILSLISLLGFVASFNVYAAKVDAKKSKVVWTGSKVVGSTHTGEVKIKSADLKYEKGEPVSGKVVIDMTTITNTDLTNEKFNKKLVDHLNSDDFFSVAKHKTAVLDIEKIEKASDKFYLIKGKLTIKGKTEPVTMKAEVTKEDKKSQVVKVSFKFDRTKYDVKYGSGTFFSDLGDKMISDDVAMEVEIHINKG